MNARAVTRAATTAATAAVVLCGVAPAQGVARARSGPPAIHRMKLATVPATPGVRVEFAGRRYTTGRDGTTVARIGDLRHAGAPIASGTRDGLRSGARFGELRIYARQWPGTGLLLRVRARRLADGGTAKLARYFHGGRIALALFYRFRPQFRSPDGRPVDRRLVQGYRLKSRTGQVIDVKGASGVTLQSTRVVPFPNRLVSKDIAWSVERVMIDGTNVVNRAQNRFLPRRLKGRPYPVRLLFYPMRITSVDAIFGFPLGKEAVLRYPNGAKRRLPLRNGRAYIAAVPRGAYDLEVKAAGIAPDRPVAVSQAQNVRLQVISWLDLAVVGSLLGGTALLLLVARRPHLRRLPGSRRSRAGIDPAPRHAVAEPPADATDERWVVAQPNGSGTRSKPSANGSARSGRGGRPTVGPTGDELYKQARQLGVTGRSSMNKGAGRPASRAGRRIPG